MFCAKLVDRYFQQFCFAYCHMHDGEKVMSVASGSTVENEFVHDYSAHLSWHLVGREVYCGGSGVSICLNTAGADAILPPATSLHLSRTG